MSGVDDDGSSKDGRSLGSLGKRQRGALQQEQWKRRPESMRKQCNNNPEQDPMEPRRGAARGSSAIGERRGSLQIVADSPQARRDRLQIVADSARVATVAGQGAL